MAEPRLSDVLALAGLEREAREAADLEERCDGLLLALKEAEKMLRLFASDADTITFTRPPRKRKREKALLDRIRAAIKSGGPL